MGLELSQKQKPFLSPKMVQSIEVLQMGTQELWEYIEKAAQENPVLEIQDQHEGSDRIADLQQKLKWLEANDVQNREYHRQDAESDMDPLNAYAVEAKRSESLCDHLFAQIQSLDIPPGIMECVQFLSGCLDQNGWLSEDLPSLARELGRPLLVMEQALAALQTLEPAGIGARSLSECLWLQLLRDTPVNRLAVRITQEYLDAMSQDHYVLIAHALKVTQDEVRQACDVIRTLNPRPGSCFIIEKIPAYVTPDVVVTNVENHFEILVNDDFLPSLSINSYYAQLLKESDDAQVKDYLTNKFKQAEWMFRAIEQRRSTIIACTKCIVEYQKGFFQPGSAHLKPLVLADVAQQIGVHVSTVSRAVSGKYLQCSKGTFPLNHFFSRRVGSPEHSSFSASTAKVLLNDFIIHENKRKPLSDQKLCQRMAERGCILSRRTIAKYREELGIPSATGRKQL